MIEGRAVNVSDAAERRRSADAYESKYGPHIAAPDGTWAGLGDAIRNGDVSLFRVAPSKAFGFGKGDRFSQTRWVFS